MQDVTVVGSFMMDLVARVSRRPVTGETVVGSDFYTSEGGKGFNQAVAAARAGAQTAMVGAVGDDDYGRSFRAFLDREGIDDGGVQISSGGTGVGLPLIEDDGSNAIVVVRRANDVLRPAHVRAALDALGGSRVVMAQLELAVDTAIEAASWAAENGAAFVLNPAPMSAIPAELLSLTSVLVPNEVELDELSQVEFGETLGSVAAAQRVADSYGLTVVATLGAQGALIAEPGTEPLRVSTPRVTAVDTVGAGDTFCGYLAAGLAQGLAIRDVVPRACQAAAVSVTRRGSASSVPMAEELLAGRLNG